VRPPRFSSYRGYGKLLAERIHVHILGHAGQIMRFYLHDLCGHGIQACYRGGRGLRIKFFFESLVFSAQNHRVDFSTSLESLPMGVKHRVYYLVFFTDDEVDFYSSIGADIFIFIGSMTSTPNGSSPRGYNWVLASDYRLSNFFDFCLVSFFLPLYHPPSVNSENQNLFWALLFALPP
jgi:hypothetical protein